MAGINFQTAIAGMTENPEFQTAMQNLLKLPKSVQALVNPSKITHDAMIEQGKKLLTTDKLALLQGENNIMRKRYGLNIQHAQDALDLAKNANLIGTLTGVANVGLSAKGMQNNYNHSDALIDYYLKHKKVP